MMGLQRTFIFSLLLHGTFAALLLLSVRFQGESGKMLNEKVFFIDLKSDVEKPSKIVVKDVPLIKSVAKKMRKEPVAVVDKREHDAKIILKDPVSDIREAGFAESLSINSEEASGITEASDKAFPGGNMEYTNSIHGEEEIIVSSDTTEDDKDAGAEVDALKLIGSAIERAKAYPAMARRRGIEGTVYVSFFIGAEGEPGEIKVIKSSGNNILDEATMKVIKKAAPYPYIKSRVEIPVTYRLND